MSARRQVAAALAVLALLGLVISVALFAGVYVAGESAVGRVVDLRRWGSGSDRTCFPVVEYTVDGERQRASTDVGASPCEHAIGDAVTVYYWAGDPGRPTVLSFGALLPIWLMLALLVIAASVGLRAPKLAERVADAEEVAIERAVDGEVVKLRGAIELDPEDEVLEAPLSGRPCVAWWVRVVARERGEPDQKVVDAFGRRSFLVKTRGGAARVDASTALKQLIDGQERGEVDHEPDEVLERLLRSQGQPADVCDTSAHHYVWYEGIFQSGDEVFVVGTARRTDGALELAGGDEPVVLSHVDREARKRAAQRLR